MISTRSWPGRPVAKIVKLPASLTVSTMFFAGAVVLLLAPSVTGAFRD